MAAKLNYLTTENHLRPLPITQKEKHLLLKIHINN